MQLTPSRDYPLSRRAFLRQVRTVAAVGAGWAALSLSRPLVAAVLGDTLRMEDANGLLGQVGAPVCLDVALPVRFRAPLRAGRLALMESGRPEKTLIPVQPLPGGSEETPTLCWMMPPGKTGERNFRLTDAGRAQPGGMAVRLAGGQYDFAEEAKPILRYNYATVEPGADFLSSVSVDNRKYAVARSNYIHPLYGLEGEVLTRDWSIDHPHHRGIYWAWPEVDWEGKRGDLHALQNVFARPAGKCVTFSGPVFCGVQAVNLWRWEDRDPVVRESAILRAYRAGSSGRFIDLEFLFEAIDKPVKIARRGTTAYGGLNVRMAAIAGQQFKKITAPAGSTPRPAWSDASGNFSVAAQASGLAVIQSAANPDYPGDWVEFPELNWLQPTFPASGTRFELLKGRPLTLRFRLWIHSGGPVTDPAGTAAWQAAHSPFSPLHSKALPTAL